MAYKKIWYKYFQYLGQYYSYQIPKNATYIFQGRKSINFASDIQFSRSFCVYNSLKNVNTEVVIPTDKSNSSDLLLSNSCVERLKKIIGSDGEQFLRVSVEGGGCSGFSYKFDIASTNQEDDRVFERNGVKVVSDETSLEYIKGSTIDYHVELIRSAFRIINNPQAEKGCSCGASFSIKI